MTHKNLHVGDIVLVKESFCKPIHYPMAIVKEVVLNNIGEVTSVTLFKGKTRETIKRHSSNLIPILQAEQNTETVLEQNSSVESSNENEEVTKRNKRQAAKESQSKTKNLFKTNLA